jgi:hypothetical protein
MASVEVGSGILCSVRTILLSDLQLIGSQRDSGNIAEGHFFTIATGYGAYTWKVGPIRE